MEGKDRIHLIGVGGIGMSGIANLLIDLDYEVSGSDLKDSEIIFKLRSKGAQIHIGHSAENIEEVDIVVFSSAIPEDNPELLEAKEKGLPILKRAEMVAKLMKRQKGIAISGTHGKTTTTSMLTTVLEKNNLDPTVLIGGELDLINGNAKLGNGDYFITEADESDGSLLFMDPETGVVTNIEADHLDYYGSKEAIKDTFIKFLNKLPATGTGIVCLDDEEIIEIVEEIDNDLITYGLNDEANLVAKDVELKKFGSISKIYYQGKKLGKLKLNVPGEHNLTNALATIGIGLHIGLNFEEINSALEEFIGVGRRFEKKGSYRGAVIVDDYAHHPTEIKATLKATKNMNFDRIIAIFQPHRYTRTQFLLEEFSKAFNDADEIIITDIYSAGETPIPGINSEKLVDLIKESTFTKVRLISELDEIYEYLKSMTEAGDLILTLGAGNIYKVGERLASAQVGIELEDSSELTMGV
ncbi:UDP-N-acetylmuramate--L-alanine ligase [Selenihalanaerobacter shriftii]|uniref:UDP-N-acetylmuramate--L-alanine ligase n=1 Tax=Selenihalanaerobacter shriftii TaxID=142842 RepID=A0A1T4JZM8_9FIRM|nr:UDP-N-acetylmuramate--L-alanine ligase [Selenihalanaerobacter shriftii]SJZ35584.1 UDP-N-acetylmuramate--L-alanine ligase [Selenihalanaerobacter shriftii]